MMTKNIYKNRDFSRLSQGPVTGPFPMGNNVFFPIFIQKFPISKILKKKKINSFLKYLFWINISALIFKYL